MDRIGRYKIVRELGRGAMGVVYHAIDPHIGRPVAIKTIHLGALRKPEEQERLRERLFREARSAGILSHPGIVTIYDVDQQDEIAYIAMEYVDGPTLDQLLSEENPIAPDKMFSVLGQTAVALDYAHQKGIVHRDIKPANIMIASDGTVKITDFGIAKVTASDQFTMTGSIVGTPHYMSPEQVQGRSVDGRSDQFSLAVIAFEMLTGEKPYTGEHLTTVVYKIVTEEPAPPHRLNPTLSGGIDGALRKALAKKPESRYATCQQFSESLEKACVATAGWKTMTRGGSLNEPTVADRARPHTSLPPSRRMLDAERVSAGDRSDQRSSGFFTFLLAVLATGGLLALIAWQGWLSPGREAPPRETRAEQKAPPPVEPPPLPAPQQTAQQEPAQQLPPVEPKPSPMPAAPQETAAAPETPTPRDIPSSRPTRPPANAPQLVSIISSPSGAIVTMDGRSDATCQTPCSIEATPGRHGFAIRLAGYPEERREVVVGSGPIEIPAILFRAPAGTLMLTSVPSGATVLINGRPTGQNTPAQLSLAPGSYQIGIEKDGRQATQTVEIRNGISTLKILLD